MTNVDIAEFLNYRREQLGLSIIELAKRSGVPLNTLSQWTYGKHLHQAEAFLRVCDVLQVDLVAHKIR